MNIYNNRRNQRGVVSIFVVVFSSLLVSIITISFVSLMVRNQQQASDNDLSNSAYDSALAGVEDAKRMLLRYEECQRLSLDDADCVIIRSVMNTEPACNMVKRGLYGGDPTVPSEVIIQQSLAGDANSIDLNQAYSCVKVAYTASDIEDSVDANDIDLIPLNAGSDNFDRIRVSWFSAEDLSSNLSYPANAPLLPSTAGWDSGGSTPPLLRLQTVLTNGSFDVDDFNIGASNDVTSTNTLFLYPDAGAGVPPAVPTSYSAKANDSRTGNNGSDPKSPLQVDCFQDLYSDGGYACRADIILPTTVSQTGSGTARNAYLIIGALYKGTDYKIEAFNGANNNPVSVVAPVVDSTGRANDLYRRVKARVRLEGDYPIARMDVNGDVCKNFSITDNRDDYNDSCESE